MAEDHEARAVRGSRVGKPGLVDAQGRIRDLSAHVPDVTGETLAPASLARLRALDPPGCRSRPRRAARAPWRVWNFIGIGLNFTDHAKETNSPVPTEPILFNKLGNCIVGPNDDVMLPKSAQFDYEVEIAFVIGTRARYVEERDALATSPATRSATTSPSATSRSSARANG